jgi:diacylglycerol kinase family enzyme
MLGVAVKHVQKMRGVHVLRASRVEVLTAAPVQIDGEFIGRQEIAVDIVPGAINLLLPPAHG